MSISLPADIEEFVRGEVESGRYDSVEDVLHEAIGILKVRERQRDELRSDIRAAVDQIESGDYFEYDKSSLKDFLDELKHEAHRAHQQATSQ
jgi:putative addiction module CopG family antidote